MGGGAIRDRYMHEAHARCFAFSRLRLQVGTSDLGFGKRRDQDANALIG